MYFVTKPMAEAAKDNWPDSEDWENDTDERTGLFEIEDNGTPVRLIAIDGGEPEDQYFFRDQAYVLVELNRLADKIRELEGK